MDLQALLPDLNPDGSNAADFLSGLCTVLAIAEPGTINADIAAPFLRIVRGIPPSVLTGDCFVLQARSLGIIMAHLGNRHVSRLTPDLIDQIRTPILACFDVCAPPDDDSNNISTNLVFRQHTLSELYDEVLNYCTTVLSVHSRHDGVVAAAAAPPPTHRGGRGGRHQHHATPRTTTTVIPVDKLLPPFPRLVSWVSTVLSLSHASEPNAVNAYATHASNITAKAVDVLEYIVNHMHSDSDDDDNNAANGSLRALVTRAIAAARHSMAHVPSDMRNKGWEDKSIRIMNLHVWVALLASPSPAAFASSSSSWSSSSSIEMCAQRWKEAWTLGVQLITSGASPKHRTKFVTTILSCLALICKKLKGLLKQQRELESSRQSSPARAASTKGAVGGKRKKTAIAASSSAESLSTAQQSATPPKDNAGAVTSELTRDFGRLLLRLSGIFQPKNSSASSATAAAAAADASPSPSSAVKLTKERGEDYFAKKISDAIETRFDHNRIMNGELVVSPPAAAGATATGRGSAQPLPVALLTALAGGGGSGGGAARGTGGASATSGDITSEARHFFHALISITCDLLQISEATFGADDENKSNVSAAPAAQQKKNKAKQQPTTANQLRDDELSRTFSLRWSYQSDEIPTHPTEVPYDQITSLLMTSALLNNETHIDVVTMGRYSMDLRRMTQTNVSSGRRRKISVNLAPQRIFLAATGGSREDLIPRGSCFDQWIKILLSVRSCDEASTTREQHQTGKASLEEEEEDFVIITRTSDGSNNNNNNNNTEGSSNAVMALLHMLHSADDNGQDNTTNSPDLLETEGWLPCRLLLEFSEKLHPALKKQKKKEQGSLAPSDSSWFEEATFQLCTDTLQSMTSLAAGIMTQEGATATTAVQGATSASSSSSSSLLTSLITGAGKHEKAEILTFASLKAIYGVLSSLLLSDDETLAPVQRKRESAHRVLLLKVWGEWISAQETDESLVTLASMFASDDRSSTKLNRSPSSTGKKKRKTEESQQTAATSMPTQIDASTVAQQCELVTSTLQQVRSEMAREDMEGSPEKSKHDADAVATMYSKYSPTNLLKRIAGELTAAAPPSSEQTLRSSPLFMEALQDVDFFGKPCASALAKACLAIASNDHHHHHHEQHQHLHHVMRLLLVLVAKQQPAIINVMSSTCRSKVQELLQSSRFSRHMDVCTSTLPHTLQVVAKSPTGKHAGGSRKRPFGSSSSSNTGSAGAAVVSYSMLGIPMSSGMYGRPILPLRVRMCEKQFIADHAAASGSGKIRVPPMRCPLGHTLTKKNLDDELRDHHHDSAPSDDDGYGEYNDDDEGDYDPACSVCHTFIDEVYDDDCTESAADNEDDNDSNKNKNKKKGSASASPYDSPIFYSCGDVPCGGCCYILCSVCARNMKRKVVEIGPQERVSTLVQKIEKSKSGGTSAAATSAEAAGIQHHLGSSSGSGDQRTGKRGRGAHQHQHQQQHHATAIAAPLGGGGGTVPPLARANSDTAGQLFVPRSASAGAAAAASASVPTQRTKALPKPAPTLIFQGHRLCSLQPVGAEIFSNLHCSEESESSVVAYEQLKRYIDRCFLAAQTTVSAAGSSNKKAKKLAPTKTQHQQHSKVGKHQQQQAAQDEASAVDHHHDEQQQHIPSDFDVMLHQVVPNGDADGKCLCGEYQLSQLACAAKPNSVQGSSVKDTTTTTTGDALEETGELLRFVYNVLENIAENPVGLHVAAAPAADGSPSAAPTASSPSPSSASSPFTLSPSALERALVCPVAEDAVVETVCDNPLARILGIAALPKWSRHILEQYHFLLSFACRSAVFKHLMAPGARPPRTLQIFDQQHMFPGGASGFAIAGAAGSSVHQFLLDRSGKEPDADSPKASEFISDCGTVASSPSFHAEEKVEVSFEGEAGSGTGVTQEFYNEVSRRVWDLGKGDDRCLRDVESSVGEDKYSLLPNHNVGSQLQAKLRMYLYVLGATMGKAARAGYLSSLSVHPAFWIVIRQVLRDSLVASPTATSHLHADTARLMLHRTDPIYLKNLLSLCAMSPQGLEILDLVFPAQPQQQPRGKDSAKDAQSSSSLQKQTTATTTTPKKGKQLSRKGSSKTSASEKAQDSEQMLSVRDMTATMPEQLTRKTSVALLERQKRLKQSSQSQIQQGHVSQKKHEVIVLDDDDDDEKVVAEDEGNVVVDPFESLGADKILRDNSKQQLQRTASATAASGSSSSTLHALPPATQCHATQNSSTEGDEEIIVSPSNVEQYIEVKCLEAFGWDALFPFANAFLQGLAENLPTHLLSMFRLSELNTLFCGKSLSLTERLFTEAELWKSIQANHGYTLESQTVRNFVQVAGARLTPREQAYFVEFLTGSPRLPPRGLAGLSRPIVIVKKDMERIRDKNGNVKFNEKTLPSCNTCFYYFKLPDYSSADVLEERLKVAIAEGRSNFSFT